MQNRIDLDKIPFEPSKNYSSRGKVKPTHIVIHTTQGAYPGCKEYLKTNHNQVSAHYVISKHGEIVCLVKPEMKAWHVCNANSFCIGLEHEGFIEDPHWITPELWAASVRLTAALVKKYEIPLDHVIGHNDPFLKKYKNNHVDPGSMWNFSQYREDVKELLYDN